MLGTVAALALLAAPAAAPDVKSMLDCWAKALGGREALAKVSSVEYEGTTTSPGDKGAFHGWTRSDGASYEEESFGPVSWRSAFDGKRAWLVEGTAPVQDVTGTELARSITGAYVDSWSGLLPGRVPGEVRPGPQPWTVVLAPKGGREWTLALEPKGCLPRSATFQSGDRAVTIKYLKWTAVNGVQFPAETEQTDGDPQTTYRSRVASTKVNVPFPDAKLARPEWKASVTIPPGKSPVTLPLQLTQNHPYAPFTLNGKGPVSFLVDTGATRGVLDSERAAQLGLQGQGKEVLRGAGAGQIESITVAKPVYGIGPVQVPGAALSTAPLKALSLREGRSMEGILGYEVLSQFVVEFDYAGNALRFHDPDSFQAPAGATVVPFTLIDTKPFVEVTVELPDGRSIPAKMIVDTGSRMALALATPFVDKHKLVEAVGKTLDAPLGFGVGGRTQQLLARVKALSLGDLRIEAPLTALSRGTKGADADQDVEGNIGGDLLRRFTAYFDYKRGRMLLVKNASWGTPFEYDMAGMLIQSADMQFKRVVVAEVIPGGPAAEAGVKAGDEVQAVDGDAVEQLPIEALRARLRAPGVKVTFKLLRGGKPVEVTLTTRRLI
ncbi:MAG TPA: aspartyl protease family protein [Myxococcaceae bacterium]|nr:aspartyl protease family protein [Myxococcaceae bacterium]